MDLIGVAPAEGDARIARRQVTVKRAAAFDPLVAPLLESS